MSKVSRSAYRKDLIEGTFAWASKLGYRIVVVQFRGKNVLGSDDNRDEKGYTKDQYVQPALSAWDTPHNLGIVTGLERGGPADTDCDCSEASFFAARFVPETQCVFGRHGNPSSHFLHTPSHTVPSERFADPLLKGKEAGIIELRMDNQQTVMPGSTHSSGELIWWTEGKTFFAAPAKVDTDLLLRAIRKVAAAVLVVRYMWHESLRNEVCLCLAGFFFRNEWPLEEAEQFIQAVCDFTKDDDTRNRLVNLRKTYSRAEKDKPTKGLPKLKELLGEDRHVNKINAWLGLEKNSEELERFNKQYAVVKVGNTSRIHEFTDEGKSEFWKFQEFENFHKNEWIKIPPPPGSKAAPKRRQAGKWWTEHPDRATYSGVCIDPTGGEVVKGKLNLWRDYGVAAAEGDWSLMREHLLRIISAGDEDFFGYVYHWLAWAIQHPTEVAEVALVFRGEEGTGRGILGRTMCRLFGTAHSVHLTSSEQLTGRFNKHLVGASFVFADEANWAGDKRAEKKLYTMITEPIISVEPKGVDLFFVPNVAHLMIVTNEDWSIPAGHHARRYAAQLVSEERMQDHEYFKALNDQLEHGGYEAMLYELKNADLGDWHPRIGVPQTDELEFQKTQSDSVLGYKDRLDEYINGACDREDHRGGVKVLCIKVRELLEVRLDNDRAVKAASKAMRELGFERRRLGSNYYVRGEPDWQNPNVPYKQIGFREIVLAKRKNEDDVLAWEAGLEGGNTDDKDERPKY